MYLHAFPLNRICVFSCFRVYCRCIFMYFMLLDFMYFVSRICGTYNIYRGMYMTHIPCTGGCIWYTRRIHRTVYGIYGIYMGMYMVYMPYTGGCIWRIYHIQGAVYGIYGIYTVLYMVYMLYMPYTGGCIC